jgi:hypothetical protein
MRLRDTPFSMQPFCEAMISVIAAELDMIEETKKKKRKKKAATNKTSHLEHTWYRRSMKHKMK